MIEVAVNNRTGGRLPLAKIKAVLALAQTQVKMRRAERVSLAFVNEKTITSLNRAYRHHDRATDVLSFGNEAGFFDDDSIGEIIICPSVARAAARRFAQAFDDEIIKLVLHGYLHLLGFDHEGARAAGRMEALERKILNKFYD